MKKRLICDDVHFYGSFKHVEPTSKNASFNLKRPKKIVVQEPLNVAGERLLFFEKNFYLSILSLKGAKICIIAVGNIDSDHHRGKISMQQNMDMKNVASKAHKSLKSLNPKAFLQQLKNRRQEQIKEEANKTIKS